MNSFEIQQKELSAKTKAIDFLENGLKSYSETMLQFTKEIIKQDNFLFGKYNSDLIYAAQDSQALEERFSRLKLKAKNYLRTISLLETKNNEQSQQISNLETLTSSLQQRLLLFGEEFSRTKKRLKEVLRQNTELESLKISQAKVIQELYLEMQGKKPNLSVNNCETLSIKSYFCLGHTKSLSIEEYENEFFKENSFNQENSFNSLVRSGVYTCNSTIKDYPQLTLSLQKKEGIQDFSIYQCSPLPSNRNLMSQLNVMIENFNQFTMDHFSVLEGELSSYSEKFSKTCEKIECFLHRKSTEGFFTMPSSELIKSKELEIEIEDFMAREEGYEGLIKELEEKLDVMLIEKRDLLRNLSVEKEKNSALSRELESLSNLQHEPAAAEQPEREESVEFALRGLEEAKTLAEAEKNYFLDHIIMIEKENSRSLLSLTKQLEEANNEVKTLESTLSKIEEALGANYKGDVLKSVKSLARQSKGRSSWNPFRKSETRLMENETPEEDEPVHFIVNKLQKKIAHEKRLHSLDKKQMEGLREMLRHAEFERELGSNEIAFKNIRMLVVDLFKHMPLQKAELEKKIQTLMALVWLNKDEKLEMEKRKNFISS